MQNPESAGPKGINNILIVDGEKPRLRDCGSWFDGIGVLMFSRSALDLLCLDID